MHDDHILKNLQDDTYLIIYYRSNNLNYSSPEQYKFHIYAFSLSANQITLVGVIVVMANRFLYNAINMQACIMSNSIIPMEYNRPPWLLTIQAFAIRKAGIIVQIWQANLLQHS